MDERPQARLGEDEVGGRLFWVAAAVGFGLIAFALIGLLGDPRAGSLTNWATFLIGGLLLHDGLFAPLVISLGLFGWFVLPHKLRPAIQATVIVAGSVVLISIPVIGRWGKLPGNPTLLPRNYTAGLAVALGVIALGGLIAALRAARHPRPAPPSGPPDSGGW